MSENARDGDGTQLLERLYQLAGICWPGDGTAMGSVQQEAAEAAELAALSGAEGCMAGELHRASCRVIACRAHHFTTM